MHVYKIHRMTWTNADKVRVVLIADTDTGEREEISTPYDATSIIWDAVKAFPVENIASAPNIEPDSTVEIL